MDAASVVGFWNAAEQAGLEICIDGGWAVDALLGRQTRQHGDLDIAIPARRVAALRGLLAPAGFVEIPHHDSWEHNFVLQNPAGLTLDVHSYEVNPDGTNRLGVPYEAFHLTGHGTILGTPVRCTEPATLVAFHTGYPLDDDDWHDVRLLCERFGLPVPVEYAGFMRDDSRD